MEQVDPQRVTVRCQQCQVELAVNSTALRLGLSGINQLLIYCERCYTGKVSPIS